MGWDGSCRDGVRWAGVGHVGWGGVGHIGVGVGWGGSVI